MSAWSFGVQTPGDVQDRLAAERAGAPFLLYRDADGRQQIVTLAGDKLVLGRDRGGADLAFPWDQTVSRVHAVLQREGGAWTLIDDGLSSNGTRVNQAPVKGRRRLLDKDVLQCGKVQLLFRDPEASAAGETLKETEEAPHDPLTAAERRVLTALCRPLQQGAASPATNKAIAGELHLAVETVKSHLRHISDKLAIENLPQNQKRSALAQHAVESGIVDARG